MTTVKPPVASMCALATVAPPPMKRSRGSRSSVPHRSIPPSTLVRRSPYAANSWGRSVPRKAAHTFGPWVVRRKKASNEIGKRVLLS